MSERETSEKESRHYQQLNSRIHNLRRKTSSQEHLANQSGANRQTHEVREHSGKN